MSALVVSLFVLLALGLQDEAEESPAPATSEQGEVATAEQVEEAQGAGEKQAEETKKVEPVRQEEGGEIPAEGEAAKPADGQGETRAVAPAPTSEPAPALDAGSSDEFGFPTAAGWTVTGALTTEELQLRTRELAASSQGWAKYESLGTSREGRELGLLVIAEPSGPAGERPGLFFFDVGVNPDGRGGEAILDLARDLLAALGTDASLRTLLGDVTVYLAPALDPDARSAREGPAADAARRRRTVFDRNFPVGWRPSSLRPGAGDVPLDKPECMAVVQFLLSHENLVVALEVLSEERLQAAEASDPRIAVTDRIVFRALTHADGAESARLVGWSAIRSAGGGIFDYAYVACGLFPFGLVQPDALEGEALGSWFDGVGREVRRLGEELPRVSWREVGFERLATNLWQLDVALENRGALPSLSATARALHRCDDLRVTLEGARLVAAARRESGARDFVAVPVRALPKGFGVEAPHLEGGESRTLRFVFETAAGVEVRLRGAAPWVRPFELRRSVP